MNVSADPRIIKQLLMTQWINNANPLDPSSSQSLEDGSVFGLLLQQAMGDGSAADASLPAPSDTLSGLMSLLGSDSAAAGLPGFGASLTAVTALAEPMTTSLASGEGLSSHYDDLIAAAAAKYGLDPALIKGVIQTESGFRAGAVSPAGAKGLMQLMDGTASGLGVSDAFDPAQNIDGGARFLSYLLRKYDGNVSSALAAYNAGPGRVDRLGLINDRLVSQRLGELPQETQGYIRKVLTAARQWGMQV